MMPVDLVTGDHADGLAAVACEWVTCSQAKMFLTALSSNTPAAGLLHRQPGRAGRAGPRAATDGLLDDVVDLLLGEREVGPEGLMGRRDEGIDVSGGGSCRAGPGGPARRLAGAHVDVHFPSGLVIASWRCGHHHAMAPFRAGREAEGPGRTGSWEPAPAGAGRGRASALARQLRPLGPALDAPPRRGVHQQHHRQ